MKKALHFIFGFIALITCYTSQAKDPAREKDNKSLLWRISGKGMQKPSYLFGTIHLICKSDYLWTPVMEESLKNSDKICLEMNLDDPSVMTQAAASMIDTSGKLLKDYFTPQQYEKLSAYIRDSLNLDISLFQQVKPFALQTMITTKSTACPVTVSYEENILKEAHDYKKEVTGLEAAQEQIQLLERIPVDSIIKDIVDALQGSNADDNEYNRLMAAYLQQDLPALYVLLKDATGLGDNMNAFIDERNKKWITRMPEKMKSGPVFFAVGAGHLWGDNGVINLLRGAGYTVEPVK